MAKSPCDFTISSYSMSSLEDLQKAVAAQSEHINVLVSDKYWLERYNNIKRVALIRLNQNFVEHQYLHQREAGMAIELEKQQQIKKEQNEKIEVITARCQHWKNDYHKKKSL